MGRNDLPRGAERLITLVESTNAGRIDPGHIDHGVDRRHLYETTVVISVHSTVTVT